jgi:hypothetical protein
VAEVNRGTFYNSHGETRGYFYRGTVNQVKDENGVVIDHTNFKDYFRDARHSRPQKGDILAKFTAVAILGDGPQKRDLIKVLKSGKAEAAAAVMHKIHCARQPDNYRVCREMCEDLLSGMTDTAVEKKEYEFVLEAVYYTKREYVPRGDPHWETIDIVKYDPETKTFHATIELPDLPKNTSTHINKT